MSDVWTEWWRRWERFQEAYVPGRELQFELIADYLAFLRPAEGLRVLDLCSGPGAAASRILQRHPSAAVVAVDHDPWLLELGRRAAPGAEQIVWVDVDVSRRWTGALPTKKFDAIVATTAMQWFVDDQLARLYGDVASLLRPGGVFFTSDQAPTGSARARGVASAATASRRGCGEHWADFWAAAQTERSFSALLEERGRRFAGSYPRAARPLEFHEAKLRAAGFVEVSEIWRHGENAILLAEVATECPPGRARS